MWVTGKVQKSLIFVTYSCQLSTVYLFWITSPDQINKWTDREPSINDVLNFTGNDKKLSYTRLIEIVKHKARMVANIDS